MDADLVALAEAYGVATWYEDWHRQRKDVSAESVVAVLGPARGGRHLARGDRAGRWPSAGSTTSAAGCPGTVVVRAGRPAGPLPRAGARSRSRTAATRGGRRRVPADLPLGWHRLQVGDQEITLVVVPTELPAPPETWGWMLQLYALHSADSWGMGDLGDLRTFLGRRPGSPGLVLLNPLHAITPTLPVPRLAVLAVQPALRQPALPAGRRHRGVPPGRSGAARAGRRAASRPTAAS